MAYPKIVYDATELVFTYPPVSKPGADERQVERFDTIADSGVKQSVYLRTDIFRTLEMRTVPQTDSGDWEDFFAWAEQGERFDYYPDAAVASYETFTLEDTSWNPKYTMRGHDKFTMRMRKVVEDDSGS